MNKSHKERKIKHLEKMKNLPRPLLCLIVVAMCPFLGTSYFLTCRKVEGVEGVPMELRCQASHPIDSCTIYLPDGSKIKIYKGVKSQNYEHVGNFSSCECAILFFKMKPELQGQVYVEVTFPNIDAYAGAKVNVTMLTSPPHHYHVESNNGNHFESQVLLLSMGVSISVIFFYIS